VALLSGPPQLWLDLTARYGGIHRRLGSTYAAAVAAGSVSAYHLAMHTDFGWAFGAGLSGLATAWLSTTGLGIAAIRRGLRDQHREWMVRSYVVTGAFVVFRALYLALERFAVGTVPERLVVAAWSCWAVPLLVAEAVLQGRKIVARR
jgi:hypothetical protein